MDSRINDDQVARVALVRFAHRMIGSRRSSSGAHIAPSSKELSDELKAMGRPFPVEDIIRVARELGLPLADGRHEATTLVMGAVSVPIKEK